MSIILNALRKSEQERQKGPVPSVEPRPRHLDEPVRWHLWRRLAAGVLAANLIVVAVVVWVLRDEPTPSDAAPEVATAASKTGAQSQGQSPAAEATELEPSREAMARVEAVENGQTTQKQTVQETAAKTEPPQTSGTTSPTRTPEPAPAPDAQGQTAEAAPPPSDVGKMTPEQLVAQDRKALARLGTPRDPLAPPSMQAPPPMQAPAPAAAPSRPGPGQAQIPAAFPAPAEPEEKAQASEPPPTPSAGETAVPVMAPAQEPVPEPQTREAAADPITAPPQGPLSDLKAREVAEVPVHAPPKEPPPAPKPEANPYQGVPVYRQLSPSFKARLPEFRIYVHVYNPETDKGFVVSNLGRHVAGDEMANNLKLEAIVEDGVVLRYEDTQFRVFAN